MADFNGDGKRRLRSRLNPATTGDYRRAAGQRRRQRSTGSWDLGLTIDQLFRRRSAAADVNGDGKVDLVRRPSEATVSVLLGNGDGSFGSPPSLHRRLGARSVAVADFNGDGKLDLVTANGVNTRDRERLWAPATAPSRRP